MKCVWSKSAMKLIIRIRYQKHKRFTVPVPVWVVDVFMEALTDLAWVGGIALKHMPIPRDEKAGKHLRWVKGISPSGILETMYYVLKDLKGYKGLDIVDVVTGDVQVKISLK